MDTKSFDTKNYFTLKFVLQLLLFFLTPYRNGRTLAQAVSRWLPTATARVRARVWQVGFVVDKVALGQVFSEYFGFPCQSLFHQIFHHHHNQPGQVQ
jgi:hypothetical protein